MKKITSWLQNANGWQRIWFVLSVITFLYGSVVFPFKTYNENSRWLYEFRGAVARNLQNPDCNDYSTKPIDQLSEPEYFREGEKGCWHLYTYRKSNNPMTIPYTLETLDHDFNKERWSEILSNSVSFGAVAIVFSALIYWFGVVIAWVVVGFRRL